MFKRQNRLVMGVGYGSYSQSKTPYFNVKIRKNRENISRFGIIVSKNVDKRAVTRNRIRRQVRSCIEDNLKRIKKGYDVLFILKKEILFKKTREICLLINKELKHQKLIE